MKSIKLIFLPGMLLFGLQLLTACEDETPNYYNQRTFELEDFSGVKLGDALQVEIIKSTAFKVYAKGEDKDINDLELKVVAGTLTGKYRTRSGSHKQTIVQIYLPELENVDVHSATKTTIKGFFNEHDTLKVAVSAASELSMDGMLKFLELSMDGASRVVISGEVSTVHARVSGASELKAAGASTENYQVEVNGASKATLNVREKLDATVNGASELKYTGSPELVESEVASDSKMVAF